MKQKEQIIKIAGIDPSIDSTGKCIMTLDDTTYDIIKIKFHGYTKVRKRCFYSTPCEISHVGTNYSEKSMYERQDIAYTLLNKEMDDVSYVAFEGYAFGKQLTRSLVQLGEFIGGMKKMFYDQGKGIIVYPPMVVKKFATGNGTAEKVAMCQMFKKEFPHLYPEEFNQLKQFESPHNDLCDAFWIAQTLRCQIIYEKLGKGALSEGTVALLEAKSNKKAMSIVETKLIKKGK